MFAAYCCSSIPKRLRKHYAQLRTLHYLPNHRIALCVPCKVAIPRNEIDSHLRVTHKDIRAKERRALVNSFEDLPIAETCADINPCSDDSPPLQSLKPPRPGFFCPLCPAFKTVSWEGFGKHRRDAHREPLTRYRKEDVFCFLQKWTIRAGPFTLHWWKVNIKSLPLQCCGVEDVSPFTPPEHCPEQRTLGDMEVNEAERIRCEDEQGLAFDDELETDENTD